MSCRVHVYLLNEHFSEEHAKEHHGGESSENNRKHQWEDELEITSDVTEVLLHENVSFPLQGELPDGSAFQYEVKQMDLFEVRSSDGPTVFVGASASIIDRCFSNSENGTHTVEIYLKDNEPMANPIPGIYIASKEFPKELIF